MRFLSLSRTAALCRGSARFCRNVRLWSRHAPRRRAARVPWTRDRSPRGSAGCGSDAAHIGGGAHRHRIRGGGKPPPSPFWAPLPGGLFPPPLGGFLPPFSELGLGGGLGGG